MFEIPEQCLAEIRPSGDSFGVIQEGPFKGLQVTSCLGDQQAAGIGHGIFDIGEIKHTYGSGCFLLVNTGKELIINPNSGLLTTVFFQESAQSPIFYGLEVSPFVFLSALFRAQVNQEAKH